ncbi:MAG: TetR/AcrR family transcriptional regulator [Lachnospiraceae bacterium]|nr:TetR/AcrR family transcriptional regulator [Lachnospiraceae bacterium]
MRETIRDDIIAVAKCLFNEQGYGNVTMRNISDKLNISVGNLTYHFNKKTDILTAIMEKNFHDTALLETVNSLSDLQTILKKMIVSLSDVAFYFRDPFLYSLNSRGREDVRNLYQILTGALNSLVEKGFFQESFTPERRDGIAKFIMLSHITWIQQNPVFNSVAKMSQEEFLLTHWTILEIYFSEKGWAQYQNSIL